MEQIIGKKSAQLTAEALKKTAENYNEVLIDLGTGDGLFALRHARANPQTLTIGIDADRASLAEGSGRAAKKPARGGAENALFFCQNVLAWDTSPLAAIASHLTINFPWGSLLAACSIPHKQALQTFATLAQNGAKFDVYLNMHTFQDEALRTKFGLPDLTEDFVQNTLLPAYQAAGFQASRHTFLEADQLDVKSTWGGKLNRRSGRDTLLIQGEIRHA